MTMRWADEFPDYDPRPSLEPFFIFVSLAQSGKHSLCAEEFAKLFEAFHGKLYRPCTHEAAMIQYMIWLDREESRETR